MKNNTNYFSHDGNANQDPNILELISENGWEGYGIFRRIIEFLFNTDGYKIELSKIKALARQMNIKNEALASSIDFMIEIGLLKTDKKYFWSESLLKRMEIKETIRKKRIEAGRVGGKQSQANAQAKVEQMLEQSSSNKSKVKQIKEKEIKESNILLEEKPTVFGKPEINELLDLIKKYNNGIIDGTQKEQRQYGNMLFDKLKQVDGAVSGKYSEPEILEIILKIISKNKFHSHKIVGPKKIYYELAGLMQICKQDFEKESSNKMPFIPGI